MSAWMNLERDDSPSLVSTMKGYKVIFSNDKDLYQLVTQDVVRVDINGRGSSYHTITR